MCRGVFFIGRNHAQQLNIIPLEQGHGRLKRRLSPNNMPCLQGLSGALLLGSIERTDLVH